MAAPIINPHLPLLTPIPGGFLSGRIIRVQGSASPTAQRFAINLQCGPNVNPRDDLALHFNPRFPERVIIRNSLVHGQWGQEERHGHFPLVPGQGFEILLLADHSCYKVAINGQHFAEFSFRTGPERVTHLSADGDLMISAIMFEGHSQPGYQPSPMPVPGYGGTAPSYPTSGYPSQPSVPYPTQPGVNPMYPTPGYPGAPVPGYPGAPVPGYPGAPVPGYPGAPVPGYPGQYPPGSRPVHHHPTYPGASHAGVGPLGGILGGGGGHGGGLLGAAGTAMGAAALGSALLNPKKAAKQQRKAQKKALKYGLPVAGVGLGAYALHKGLKHGHHGFHHGSSSSSSSSSEEE